MQSLSDTYLTHLRFDSSDMATLRALGEHQGKQRLHVAQFPEVLSDLRQTAVIESTESSNRLEGVVVSPGRLKSLVLGNSAPRSRSEQEIAGYLQVADDRLEDYMIDRHANGFRLNFTLICRVLPCPSQ